MFKLTKYADHYETNVWLSAAEKRGWEIEVISKEKSYAVIKKNGLKYQIIRGSISANSKTSSMISTDKYLTNAALKNHVANITKPTEFNIDEVTDQNIIELLDEHKKLVVKPLDTNNGIGVTTSITDLEGVKRAIERIEKLGLKRIIIENHINVVHEYRIILWKGKMLDVVERIPAFVTGDGTSTIEELIKEKNQMRLEKFGDFLDLIEFDNELTHFLAQKNLTLQSIPSKDEVVSVRQMCNMSQGGESKRIPLDEFHPKYKDIFKKIYKSTWLNYCGLDLICSDISAEPNPEFSVINEINGAPGPSLSFYADVIEERPLYGAQLILDSMENDPVLNFTPTE